MILYPVIVARFSTVELKGVKFRIRRCKKSDTINSHLSPRCYTFSCPLWADHAYGQSTKNAPFSFTNITPWYGGTSHLLTWPQQREMVEFQPWNNRTIFVLTILLVLSYMWCEIQTNNSSTYCSLLISTYPKIKNRYEAPTQVISEPVLLLWWVDIKEYPTCVGALTASLTHASRHKHTTWRVHGRGPHVTLHVYVSPEKYRSLQRNYNVYIYYVSYMHKH